MINMLAPYRKGIIGFVSFVLTFIGALLDQDLIPSSVMKWIFVFIAVASAYGVYAVPNIPTNSPVKENKHELG